MNIATEKLCKELYNASGRTWKNTDIRRYYDYGMFPTHEKLNGLWLPAYDLGYLLRKLPGNYLLAWHDFEDIKMEDGSTTVQGRAYAPVTWGDDLDVWESFYDNTNQASTPEDAACKLAIALFKHGELKADTKVSDLES